jgi:hypothetical protein
VRALLTVLGFQFAVVDQFEHGVEPVADALFVDRADRQVAEPGEKALAAVGLVVGHRPGGDVGTLAREQLVPELLEARARDPDLTATDLLDRRGSRVDRRGTALKPASRRQRAVVLAVDEAPATSRSGLVGVDAAAARHRRFGLGSLGLRWRDGRLEVLGCAAGTEATAALSAVFAPPDAVAVSVGFVVDAHVASLR